MSDSRGGCQLAGVPCSVLGEPGRASPAMHGLAPGGVRTWAPQAAVGEYTADTGPPGWPALSSRPPRRVHLRSRGAQPRLHCAALVRCAVPGSAWWPVTGGTRGLLLSRPLILPFNLPG